MSEPAKTTLFDGGIDKVTRLAAQSAAGDFAPIYHRLTS